MGEIFWLLSIAFFAPKKILLTNAALFFSYLEGFSSFNSCKYSVKTFEFLWGPGFPSKTFINSRTPSTGKKNKLFFVRVLSPPSQV